MIVQPLVITRQKKVDMNKCNIAVVVEVGFACH